MGTREPPPELLHGLDVRQREAVVSLDGPLLVVAGPGSGKTRMLTHRVAAIAATGTEPWRILAVTFTNKAAGEMRERIETLVGAELASEMWVTTFHALCARLLRRHPVPAGLRPGFAICDADDARKILRAAMADCEEQADGGRLGRMASRISTAKNRMEGVATLERGGSRDRATAAVWTQYQQLLSEQNLVDFDDLLLGVLRMLRGSEELAQRYANRFVHVLVDEFQDTNRPQYEIVKILAGTHRNLCVVGDQDQSVYAWRGADPSVVDRFDTDWPDATVVVLDRNYRSSASIVQAARSMIAPNPATHRAELWTDAPPGTPVVGRVTVDDRAEARFVGDTIAARIQAGKPAAAHAVLYRTNAQSRLLEEELLSQGIGYRLVGSLRFYDRAEIRDAVSWLRVTLNPYDAIALARSVTVPRRGIGPATLAAVRDCAATAGTDPISAARELVREGVRGSGALATFLEDLDTVVDAASRSASEAVRAVLAIDGFRQAAVSHPGSDPGERFENLAALISDAVAFENDPPPNVNLDELEAALPVPELVWLAAFCEHAALMGSADDNPGALGGVTLCTMHAAKGREWPFVFVTGMEDELIPHANAADAAGIAEERRLAFVAVSRAKDELWLTRACRRMVAGKVTVREPSPFLDAIADSVTWTSDELDRTSTGRRNDWMAGSYRR